MRLWGRLSASHAPIDPSPGQKAVYSRPSLDPPWCYWEGVPMSWHLLSIRLAVLASFLSTAYASAEAMFMGPGDLPGRG